MKVVGGTPPPPLFEVAPVELCVAYVTCACCYGWLLTRGFVVSAQYDPGMSTWHPKEGYRRLSGLRPGWMFGRYNDLSDAQWRVFRESRRVRMGGDVQVVDTSG